MELDGRVDLRAWLSIDAPDTDLLASLYLINPDGKVHLLDQNVMRARYQHGLSQEEPIRQNTPEEHRFDNGSFFAMRAEKCDRLRLIVGSLNDPFMKKNWNSMKPVLQQSGADARVAHIRLVQDARHPFTLVVPVGDLSQVCKASADW
jgi:predicted acyl esterase